MKQDQLESILNTSINDHIVQKGLQENRQKLTEQKEKDLKSKKPPKTETGVQINSSVKQTYGASIRGYMSYWSGY